MFEILIITTLFLYLIIGVFPTNISSSDDGYSIANRKLSPFQSGMSIVASKVGGGLLISYSSLFFVYGYSAFSFFFGAVFGYFIFYFIIKKLFSNISNQEVYSISDLFTNAYGKTVSKLVGVLVVVSMFGWIITNLTVGANIIEILVPEWGRLFVILSILTVVISYLLYGGFLSVIRTDVVQTLMIMVILLIVFGFLFTNNSFSFSLSFEWSNDWVQILSFFILGIFFPLGSAELYQRIIACNNQNNKEQNISKDIKNTLLLSSVFYIIFGIILTLISIIVSDITFFATVSPDQKLTIGVFNYLVDTNPVISTLWMIAFLAIIISSVDTFIFTSASSLVQDVLNKKQKSTSQIRVSVLFFSIIAAIISYANPPINVITLSFVSITLLIAILLLILRFNAFFEFNTKTIYLLYSVGVLVIIFSIYQIIVTEKPIYSIGGITLIFVAIMLKFSLLIFKKIVRAV